jgi:mRNA interferase MazF
MAAYVPARGDYIWLESNPQLGHEPARHRPALVLSPEGYNAKTNLLLACPITSQATGYPFEVQIAEPGLTGAILTDQIQNLDWQIRRAEYIGRCSPNTLTAVTEKLLLLIER